MVDHKSRVRAAGRAAHWLENLDIFQVQFLILNARHDRVLIEAVRNHPAWSVDHDDGDTVLLTRTVLPLQTNHSQYAVSSLS